MFSFLPLINKLVTIEFSFLLLIISAIITSKTINFCVLYLYCIHQYFCKHLACHLNTQWKLLDHHNDLSQLFHLYWLNIDILLHVDLLHRNIFYQYLAGFLLNLKLHLFFQTLSLLLLVFCMDDLEYMAPLNYVVFCFHSRNHQKFIKIYILLSISLSHNLKAFIPYRYVVILSDLCNLLSSLLLCAVLLICSL